MKIVIEGGGGDLSTHTHERERERKKEFILIFLKRKDFLRRGISIREEV